MIHFESPTKLKSLEPAFEGEESVGEERETSVGETTDTVSVSGTKRGSYFTTVESRASRRARTAAREDAVLASSPAPAKISKGKASSPAPAETSKGKADKLDISSIRWMELHNERNGKDGWSYTMSIMVRTLF